MFEKEIEFIYNYNLNKIQHLNSFISYEQLISTDIHPALLQYISAEIDFLIYEDRQKLLHESVFDYSSDKIIEQFTNIGEEIKKSKKFSLEYLTKLLLHASSFNVNFIIRPKWSLLQFVYESENESSKPVVEVKQILNYLYYYPYLRRLLISFFNKKRILTITSNELEELLVKIDKINYESNFKRVLDSALNNMAEFINMGGSTNSKISKQSIELFLEDKGLSQYKMILDEKFGDNDTNKHEINDYKKVILGTSIEVEPSTTSEEYENIDGGFEDFQEKVRNVEREVQVEESLNSEMQSDDEDEIENIEVEESIEVEVNNDEVDLVDDEQSGKKTFLESYIDGLDEEKLKAETDLPKKESDIVDSEIEEIEPPDFDEAPRVDDEIIDEAYEFATEEEKLDTTVDEDTELERVEIKEDEGDPFDDNDEEKTNLEKEMEESSEISSEKKSDGYIELGNSVTFSSDQLTKEEDSASKLNSLPDDDDEWPTESSNTDYDELDLDEFIEKLKVSDIPEEIEKKDSLVLEDDEVLEEEELLEEDEEELEDEEALEEDDEVLDDVEVTEDEEALADEEVLEDDEALEDVEALEVDKILDDVEDEIEEVKKETTERNSETNIAEEELTNDSETNFQEGLFNDDNFEETKEESVDIDKSSEEKIADEEGVSDKDTEVAYSSSIDISVLLENRKITKIIEVVFDYDMEEFASAIEKISKCKNEIEVLATIDEIANSLFIDVSSKEIKVFKNIISSFFK